MNKNLIPEKMISFDKRQIMIFFVYESCLLFLRDFFDTLIGKHEHKQTHSINPQCGKEFSDVSAPCD